MPDEIGRILVPMDGSEYSKRAASKAIAIGKKFGSHVTFLTAVSAESVPNPGQLLGILKNDENLQKTVHEMICTIRIEITKILMEQVAACERAGVKADYEIVEGDPVSAILEFSKAARPDLIVVGSHGLSGLGKIKALGSVSRNVSEMAKCPVLIVR
jgi:nucleotide-binding universal stress UspA family protein